MTEEKKLREAPRENEEAEANAKFLESLRDQSLRQLVERETDSVDPFHVPEELKPDGFTVEWKATHVMGKELDAAYVAALQQDGWVAAPASLFRKMLPEGSKEKTIKRGGQLLMMRPKEITEKRRSKEKLAAEGQVKAKLQSIGMAPQGTMDRAAPNLKQVVKRSYEKVEIPD